MPPSNEETLLRTFLAEVRKVSNDQGTILAELRKLTEDVRYLNKVVLTGNNGPPLLTEIELLKQRFEHVSKQANEITVSKNRILSDIRELKEDATEIKTKVILLDREVEDHDKSLEENHRISQISVTNELELEQTRRIVKEKTNAEKTQTILKILAAAIAAIIAFISGKYLK